MSRPQSNLLSAAATILGTLGCNTPATSTPNPSPVAQVTPIKAKGSKSETGDSSSNLSSLCDKDPNVDLSQEIHLTGEGSATSGTQKEKCF